MNLSNPNSPDNFLLTAYGLLASLTANGTRLARTEHRQAIRLLAEGVRDWLMNGVPLSSEKAHTITDALAYHANDPVLTLAWALTDALFVVPNAPKAALDAILSELVYHATQAATSEGALCLHQPQKTTLAA
jgi:hypothetical protein